ncbi:MAG: glycosyltransferase, partial [Candidatus Binatia bacterium]
MRVLMLTSSYPKFPGDGTAPFIEEIALEVARRGAAVDVVLPRHRDLVTEGRASGRPLRFFPYFAGPRTPHVWGYASSMVADRRLRSLALAVVPFAAIAAIAAIRRRLATERYDLVHAHWALPNGPLAALGCPRSGPPLVVSLHGSDVFVAERSRLLRALARRVLERAAAVSACSRDLAARALRIAPGVGFE